MYKSKFSTVLLILLVMSLFAPAANAQFSDIEKDSLTYMYRHGIIDGYPDGTFGPENKINRAELLKMIIDASHKETQAPTTNCFPDVPKDEWYTPYVCTAKDNGWVDGYPDSSFKPDQNINNVETLKIIAKIQDWTIGEKCSSYETSFSDLEKCAWYYNFVTRAEEHFFIDKNELFNPAKEINREETAEILFRTILEEKLGRLGINDPIALTARNFFKVEEAALNITFQDAQDAADHAAITPHLIINPPIENTWVNRNTIIETEDGNTYAVLPVPLTEELESERCPFDCIYKNMIAKFNSEKELVAFDWLGTNVVNHQSVFWNLVSVENSIPNIEIWFNGESSTSIYETPTMSLEELRL